MRTPTIASASAWRLAFLCIIVGMLLTGSLWLWPQNASGDASSENGWVWLNPLPQGNHLRALWGSGPNDVYAVGEVGVIMHYDGSTWQPLSNLPGEDTLLGVWGAGPKDIFAVGVNALWHYDGASWKAMDPPAGTPEFLARGVWGASGNDVYVASYVPDRAAIFHYDGAAWNDMDVPVRFYTYLYDIWGSGPNNIFAVGEQGTIFHYNGYAWQEMNSPTQAALYAVWGSGPNDVYAGGYSIEDFEGIVLHYDGASWKKVFSPDVQIVSIWGFAADDIYAMDSNGNVYHFDGQSWKQVWDFISQRTSHLYDLWGTGPNNMFAVGWDGVVTHYDGSQWRDQIEGPDFQGDGGIWTDGQRVVSVGSGPKALVYDGAQWTLYTLPREIPNSMWMSGHANDLWGPSWDDIYAVGDGLIWHFDGQTWTRVHQMLSEDGEDMASFWGVWGFSPTDIYAVGYLYDSSPGNIYIILHYDGSQWSIAYQGRGEGELVDIWGSSPNDIFVAAKEGGMLHYNGYSWSQMSTTYFDSVWGTGPNDVWATGRTSSGGAAIYHYDGTQWSQSYENIRFALDRVWGTGPNDVYAIGSQAYSADPTLSRAVVLHYDGSQWREIDAPFSRHMRQINGAEDMLLMTGYGDSFLGMGHVPPPVRTWATPEPTPTPTPTPTIPVGNCPDAYEPNDDFDSAIAITPGVSIQSYICHANDLDWFKFYVSAGQAISSDLTNIPAGVDYDLWLYAPSGGIPVASSTNGGQADEHISYTATVSGDYRIFIANYSNSDPVHPYTLRVELSGTPATPPTPTHTPTPTPTSTPTPLPLYLPLMTRA